MAYGARPDLMFGVNALAHVVSHVTEADVKVAKSVLRYLASCPDLQLTYRKQGQFGALAGFSDASLGARWSDCRSTIGYCVFLFGCVVSFATKLTAVVSLSTCEAELWALVELIKEMKYHFHIVKEAGFDIEPPFVVHLDAKSAIDVTVNPKNHRGTRHIDLRVCFARFEFESGFIVPKKVAGVGEQLADVFTKFTSNPDFTKHRERLQLELSSEEG